MKILYSHRTRSADGQYVHIAALTAALRARGHEVLVCGPEGVHGAAMPGAASSGASKEKPLSAGGGHAWAGRSFWATAAKPVYELAELGYSLRGSVRLEAAARAFKPDILYERYNLFYHAGARLARRCGIPFVLEVNAPLVRERRAHGGLALKSAATWSERSIWRAADAVLPVTGVLAEMIRAAGVDDDAISVIPNGVDAAFLGAVDPSSVRRRYGIDDRLILGFTGFARPWHGVHQVLDFMAKARKVTDRPLHFLLVGDGPVRRGLEDKAQRLGLQDHLTITGVVQRDEAPVHVAAFDVALQPAVIDYASPLKLFEYMALSKPIVAPASANIREVLTDGDDAALFAAGDPSAFEAALLGLVRSPERRRQLGDAARGSLERQKLTWAENAARVERIAERLILKKSGP